jgi:prefoldin alpha subunit
MANVNKGAKKVEISELSVYQLSGLKQQLQQEIEILSQSVERLIMIRQRFRESKDCVQRHSELPAETEILVPLTGSMYVNGSVDDTQNFLIDIGTGYYVEKDAAGSIDFFERKITFLTKEIEQMVKQAEGKAKMRDSIIETLQYRQQHQQQAAAN